MAINQDQIDCGADALRRYEQGGKMLRDWDDLPTSTKKKWREKAQLVMDAITRETDRQSKLMD